MQKGIISKKHRAHSGGREDLNKEEEVVEVSPKVDLGYSGAFLSYDETSSGLSFQSESSSTSSSESNQDSKYSSHSSNSYTYNTNSTSSDGLVSRGREYGGLSHFEKYCKKRQRRATTDGTIIDKLMKNNQIGSTENSSEPEPFSTTSFHEEHKKEKNRSSPVMVKGLKAPKKLGMPDRTNMKAPSCVVVSKLSDDISILSEPAALGKKVMKRTRNFTKQSIRLEKDQSSSHSENPENIYSRESDDGMSSKTSIGFEVCSFPYEGLHETQHICDDTNNKLIQKQSKSANLSLDGKSSYSRVNMNKSGEAGDAGIWSEGFQTNGSKIVAPHSLNSSIKQTNIWKLAKSNILKLRGRQSVHRRTTIEEYDKVADQTFLQEVHDALQPCDALVVNEDGSIKNKKIVYHKFGGNPAAEMKLVEYNENLMPASNSSEVLLRIEASTVSTMDSKIRRSLVKLPFSSNDEITPGIDVVGIVEKCGDAATTLYGISQNDRVASLVGTGGNAKFISLDASKVVRLPSGVSAVAAAAVIESYLPAFQALVYGMTPIHRYSSSCLQGKSVLIIGGISNLGQALIQLSLYFGAAKVYTTAISKHHALLRSLGAIPLDASLDTSLCEHIHANIDLTISNYIVLNIQDVMKVGGKIVFLGEGRSTRMVGLFSSIYDFVFLRMRGLSTCTYDMFYEWENEMERSKKDLSYLFGLLRLNRITPQVARTIQLKNVPKAHVYLESNKRVQGTMVCLPSNVDNWECGVSR